MSTDSADKPVDFRSLKSGGRVMQPIQGDVLSEDLAEQEIEVSVICPFYNEEKIVGSAIHSLLDHLESELDTSWELIVVNDGSKDDSVKVAEEIAADHPKLRLLSYRHNRGRGHALRTGIAQARGSVIVTTEIDLSWGEDIVERLLAAMREHPDADIVVASPHLPGGGYKNVPFKRVFLSRFGNHVVRALMSDAATMNTGMTRAYRREAIQSLPLHENGKEFHLEVILKAQALGYRIEEIPALLEWKNYKHKGKRVKRKSSSKVNKLMVTHSLFSLFAQPIRYIWPLSALSMFAAGGFLVTGIIRLFMSLVSVYMLIVALAFALISMLLFIFGVLTQQGSMLQVEVWRLKQDLVRTRSRDKDQSKGGAPKSL
ncbi:MAG: glycosyltransferase family 2 protein [Verrucomicrobia bacterium]|nr:glycosyltransferase family 2 protein [Verrucomicrobiota bacterium]